MTLLDDATIPGDWITAAEANEANKLRQPRKLRGLRFPVIPTGAWLAQVGGGIATLTGTFMLAGAAVTLIVGGVSAVVLGALREAGKV